MKTVIGVMGGSGLYELPGLTNVQEVQINTPFGPPSDTIVSGEFKGTKVCFLPRHGKGHRFTPSEVNYRANIYALKAQGVTHVLSVSAVGSLQENLPPGSMVIPSQILDRTSGQRPRSFFGNGVVGHVSFADPYCPEFQKVVKNACGSSATLGGTYVCVEGPRFSTRAESLSFRKLEASVIGMTAMPEAILAREAEMAYVTLCFVTDYDCWRENEEAVTVEAVMAVLKSNVELSKKCVAKIIETMPTQTENPIFSAAQFAIMTPQDLIPIETKRNLQLMYGKYWNGK